MRINLKDFRQAHKLFQSDIAEMLGMNQSNVSRAEIRGYHDLTFPQKETLYGKFGKEDVDSFVIEDSKHSTEQVSVVASGNTNDGDGTQYNGSFGADGKLIAIIGKQADALIKLSGKQSELTDRLMALLEKLSEKI